ncbi:major facilitator superfamily-related transporter [Plasmodium brasilianum]|uniref:Major facilitator superfamily-related transporter n=1 Tax=Plasmodium brasilianum TaxID=5824 RepID=A0ACB9YCQ3_PLABR|nr:major facilitator superfamily-related transporter [Plasmodium brasilianum]
MRKLRSKITIFLFMYSIATTAIVYQNYIFIANIFKKYRAFEWLCKNEKEQRDNDFFLCKEQENYIQFLLVTGLIIQFISGSIGSILIKIFSKKKYISQVAFIFLFIGWTLLSVALHYSKSYMDIYALSAAKSSYHSDVTNNRHSGARSSAHIIVTDMQKMFQLISLLFNISFICFGIGSDNSYLPIIYYINEIYPVKDNIMEKSNKTEKSKLNTFKTIMRNKNYILISTMSSLAVLSLFVGNVIIITLDFLEFKKNVIVIILVYILICIFPSFFIANMLEYKKNYVQQTKKEIDEQEYSGKYIHEQENSYKHICNSDPAKDIAKSIGKEDISSNAVIYIVNYENQDNSGKNKNEKLDKCTPEKNVHFEEIKTDGGRSTCTYINEKKEEKKVEKKEEKKMKGFFKNISCRTLKKQLVSPFYIFIVVEFFIITFSICFFMFSLFDIYENNVFGNTLNIYSLILPSSFIITLIFGIVADVISIYNFISFNLILGILVFALIFIYYKTASVIIGYVSLIIYFFHQSFFANHMYMYMSTVFKEENFSVLIGIINTFASFAFFLSFKIYEHIKYQKHNSTYKEIITQVIFSSYLIVFLFHIFYIKRNAQSSSGIPNFSVTP